MSVPLGSKGFFCERFNQKVKHDAITPRANLQVNTIIKEKQRSNIYRA
jgi:hypothetical protein